MAQFDVHATTVRNRNDVPFLVVVQSRRFDEARTRIVIPLLRRLPGAGRETDVLRYFRVADVDVVLDPLQIQTVPLAALGALVWSLADDVSAGRIIAALDLAISRAWG